MVDRLRRHLPDNPAYDALETLAWIAAKTERVRLHTAILVPLFQQPVVLARRVATIDHLSGGRMDLGIAMGWLPEGFEATGVPARGRSAARRRGRSPSGRLGSERRRDEHPGPA